MKGGIAIILLGLMILPAIVLAKTNKAGSPQPTCKEWCESQPHVTCEGKWKISGKYPDCKCEFKCDTKNDPDDNKEGPWNAIGKNKLLCLSTIITDTQEVLLKHKKGNFEAWSFNGTGNSTGHYIAFPISWYKPKVVEKKVDKEHWQLINITDTDPRAVQCGISPGMYIVKVSYNYFIEINELIK
jgi:hypothetical protein